VSPGPSFDELRPSDLAPGLLLGDDVEFGEGVRIGGYVVIHARARIGDGCLIGDHAQIRDRVEIGAGSLVGVYSALDPDTRLGERVRMQGHTRVSSETVIEDDVFIGPGVMFTNDRKLGRHAPDDYQPVTLRRACRVAASVVLSPGVEVGEEALIAAGAVVIDDVPARAVMAGVPARKLREVGDEDLLEKWR
jgi:UDP-2-acetamido-3-amino-2,3-dideoxy-glucuronate N-acetyltransferase